MIKDFWEEEEETTFSVVSWSQLISGWQFKCFYVISDHWSNKKKPIKIRLPKKNVVYKYYLANIKKGCLGQKISQITAKVAVVHNI